MICRVLPDEIHDRHLCAAGVMEIGKAVGQSRPKVKQSARRFASHASVTIRSAGHHTFKKTENASHGWKPIQCRHQMHL